MKKMKRLVALALSVVMVLAMSVFVFAGEVKNSKVNITGHTFEAYQIFSGKYEENTLSNIQWGNGVDGAALLTELKAYKTSEEATPLKPFEGCDSPAKVAEELAKYNETSEVVKAFTRIVNKHLATKAAEGEGSVTLGSAGYYLIKDVTNLTNADDARNLSVLKVTEANATVTPTVKTDKPELVKKVKDTNDSTGAVTEWQDSADYDIGDTIPYQLTATMGDLSNYDTYYINFVDTMTNLTYTGITSVKVGNTILAENQYTVNWNADKKILQVSIADVKQYGASKGTKVVVEYTATLDETANIGSTGNPNTAYLEYSNNPDNAGNGETGKTPTDKNIVFTYKVVANKFNESNQPLEGAQFTLYKKVNGQWESKGQLQGSGDNKNVFAWNGLDDGEYKIEETVTPSTYNKIDDIVFTITANHEISSDNPALTSLTGGDVFTGEVQTDGTITGSVVANIVNKKGSTLPSTGGIGTTIFYVVGAILMVGAAVLLITKRRAEN